MTGDIMSYAHKDIYYLETKAKTQTTADLVNLFASPAGRELIKYKPKPKTKYKSNTAAMDLFGNKTTPEGTSTTPVQEQKPGSPSSEVKSSLPEERSSPQNSRRRSLDLYNEAAAILGLTCSQTNDCRCLECQCHYFDFDDDLDYSTSEGYTEHQSVCSIQ